jgi:hypothetical protein
MTMIGGGLGIGGENYESDKRLISITGIIKQ